MFVMQDFLVNGRGGGAVGDTLGKVRFDPGLLRPYFEPDTGQPCCTINTGKIDQDGKPVFEQFTVNELRGMGINVPVHNATQLRKDEWIQLDRAVIRAARQRLRAWADLAGANTFGGFNAMAKTILEHETMSDPGEAIVDMDGLSEGRSDSPRFKLEGLPLPITHSSFFFGLRKLSESRNNGTPLDTTMGEASSRRVAETIEKTTIGAVTGITYGAATDYDTRTPTVYGYRNFPQRITKTNMTTPTGSNGPTVLTDWLALRDLLYDAKHYGPFMVYVNTQWDQYLDNLFSTSEPSAGTLRSRLLQIDGISDIRRLDYLDTSVSSNYDVLFVEMMPETARAINGMDITVVQWESHGGMQLNFKVMAIQVPQLRSDYNDNCGIAHGTIA